MNHLKPLVMMQLKDKIDFSFLKSKKKTITKTVFTILGFVAVIAVCYLLFTLCGTLNLFSLLPTVPITVMVVIFSLMFLLSCVSCTYGLMKKLYFAPDNQVLLTLPVKSNQVFLSKLIVFYIYELIKNLYFMIPVFIAYGVYCSFSILYYPWMIICFLFISALPVLIGAILSIPLMFITTRLKQVPWLRFILFTLIIGVVMYAVIKLISIIPENFNLMQSWGTIFWSVQDFLNAFSKIFIPLAWLVKLLCGEMVNLSFQLFSLDTLFIFLGLIGTCLVLFVIAFILARPLFFKMASKPFEYKKRLIKSVYTNKHRKGLRSGIYTNLKISLRTPEFLYNYIGILFVLPIAILLLNKVFSAMNTRLLGTYLTFAFNVLIIMLILLSSNVIISSIFSKEGRSSYYFKTSPRAHIKMLVPKLVFSLVISAISVLVSVIIFNLFAKVGFWNFICCYLFFYGMYVAHLFWSAEMDIMNPQNEQYATSGVVESNPNEKKSTLFAFIISVLSFGISLLLFTENIAVAWLKLMIIALIFAAARIYLFIGKVKVFYKEK